MPKWLNINIPQISTFETNWIFHIMSNRKWLKWIEVHRVWALSVDHCLYSQCKKNIYNFRSGTWQKKNAPFACSVELVTKILISENWELDRIVYDDVWNTINAHSEVKYFAHENEIH